MLLVSPPVLPPVFPPVLLSSGVPGLSESKPLSGLGCSGLVSVVPFSFTISPVRV